MNCIALVLLLLLALLVLLSLSIRKEFVKRVVNIHVSRQVNGSYDQTNCNSKVHVVRISQ